MEFKENKRCPRCNTKVPKGVIRCPKCQLDYNKFDLATNAEAKRAMRMGEHDRVLMRKGYPTDVKKWQFVLLTIFLGYTGANYYYIGRYKRGLFYTVFFIFGLVYAVLSTKINVTPSGDLFQVFYFLVLIWGLVLVFWLFDIMNAVFNRFKIPVSLPHKGE